MRIVTAEAAQKIDNDAINIRGISGPELMAAAGKAVTDAALVICRREKITSVQIFCGKGNNGGDGYVAAAELKKAGIPEIDVFAFTKKEDIRGDAEHHYRIMREAGVNPVHINDISMLEPLLKDHSCWIDAIFGTGLNRPVRGFLRDVMKVIRDFHRDQPVLAVDIPSGIHGTNGRLLGPALKAQTTVCMGFYKSGNFLQDGKAYCGDLQGVDLDYPAASFEHAVPSIILCDHEEITTRLRPIAVTGHKYTMGQVLCLGGSAAMPGAVTLASQAALKSGAGMLRAFVPRKVKNILLHHLIETVVDIAEDEDILIERDLPQLRKLMREKSRVLLAGPGFGRAPESGRLLRSIAAECTLPLVLDADALFHLQPQHIKKIRSPRVITPHAGEFARLLNKDTEEVLNAPLEYAKEFAVENECILHLKGSTSLTALPSGAVYLHVGGVPGMATAGSGDVLAGMIAAFIAQGHPPEDATLIAAYYHGKAGQAAAETLGNRSITASALLKYLPPVLKKDEVLV
ncbi:MAG: NAD(P)H-hydrate dehydratase [Fidelibacterota bacterium]